MNKTETKEIQEETIFDTPTYHRGRSLEEQQERHRAGTGHTRVGELGARVDKNTKMIHVFQKCLDCAGLEPLPYTYETLLGMSKEVLLVLTKNRELPGNKQTSKHKLADTILKSY